MGSPSIRMRTSAMGSISSTVEGSTEWMFFEPAMVITRWNHEPSLDPISMEQRNVLAGASEWPSGYCQRL